MNAHGVARRSLFALAMLMSGIAHPVPAAADDVLGTLGAIQLRTDEVRQLLNGMNAAARAQLAASKDNLDRLVRQELVRRELAEEARAKGWDKRPEVMQAIARARQQVLISFYLNSLAQPEPGYPGDEEVRAFYEANKAQFVLPKQYHVAQIYLAVPRDADSAAVEAAKDTAEDVSARARSGADFAELASKYSQHKETASRGGDAGWIAENRLMPEIRTALDALSPDGVSGPVRTRDGWQILKLLEIKPAAQRPLKDLRNAIAAELRARKVRENESKYENNLVRDNPPVIDEAALAKLQDAVR